MTLPCCRKVARRGPSACTGRATEAGAIGLDSTTRGAARIDLRSPPAILGRLAEIRTGSWRPSGRSADLRSPPAILGRLADSQSSSSRPLWPLGSNCGSRPGSEPKKKPRRLTAPGLLREAPPGLEPGIEDLQECCDLTRPAQNCPRALCQQVGPRSAIYRAVRPEVHLFTASIPRTYPNLGWGLQWVGFVILPLFALTNAGFLLSSGNVRSPLFLAVFVGLTVGKPLGWWDSVGWQCVSESRRALPTLAGG
jgi:hypothetical protein